MRHVIYLALAALGLAMLGLVAGGPTASASAATGPATTGVYGAFAYSPSNHLTVASGYGSTPALAEQAAESACSHHAADCLPVVYFIHSYATYETGANGAWSWGSAPTLAAADAAATSWCSTHGGGSACAVRLHAETTAPSSADHGTDLMGRMCMLNAPSGVTGTLPSGLEVVGHVGWAYLQNRDTGVWEFGANEGPGEGKPALEWYQDGTWPDLVSVFTHKLTIGRTVYHKANFYLTYRCASEPAGFTSDAHAKVLSEQHTIYYLPFFGHPENDCLSNAVDVLSADGVGLPNDEEPIVNALPNHYYGAVLPSLFAPAASLG